MIVAVLCCPRVFADENITISSIQYWIDENHTAATVCSMTEFDLDCSILSPGMHTLNYRVSDSNGKNSALHQHSFMKLTSPTKATNIASLQYWWDDMHNNAVISPYSEDQFILSTDALPVGLHSLKYRVTDDTGRWSEVRSHFFYKGEARDSVRIESYSYWWNDLKDSMITKRLDTYAATFELDEDFTVPEDARTGFAGHYTATLNIIVTDNHGYTAFLATNVTYPDNDAPVTDIDADKYVTSSTVKLTWVESTNDAMGDYNVYYSKDGGPFVLWLPDTNLTTANFKGERGSAYLFTVTGRDATGNREEFDETKCVSVTFE